MPAGGGHFVAVTGDILKIYEPVMLRLSKQLCHATNPFNAPNRQSCFDKLNMTSSIADGPMLATALSG
ncbi:MAG: hypothetical protein JWP58_3791 [Hymenobacter sp.]|nr:hypothetical protein [Hymenobacter sp.]